MNDQIDVNEILDALKERIGQLEVDKAILMAQLKGATAGNATSQNGPTESDPLPDREPDMFEERSN